MKAAQFLRAQNFSVPSINYDRTKRNNRQRTSGLDHNYDQDTVNIRTNNIMFDVRVCRGNTYANAVVTEDQMRNREVYERNQRAKERRREEWRRKIVLSRKGTPPPVEGRLHVEIQTDGSFQDLFVGLDQVHISESSRQNVGINDCKSMQSLELNLSSDTSSIICGTTHESRTNLHDTTNCNDEVQSANAVHGMVAPHDDMEEEERNETKFANVIVNSVISEAQAVVLVKEKTIGYYSN